MSYFNIWIVRKTLRFIKRMIDITPIIWNNCDCDHSEVTELFQYQLKKVVDKIEKRKNHVGWEHTVTKGRRLLRLGEKVYSNFYELEPFHFEGDMKSWIEWFNEREPGFDEKVEAARRKQEKAKRIYYEMVKYYLPYIWD